MLIEACRPVAVHLFDRPSGARVLRGLWVVKRWWDLGGARSVPQGLVSLLVVISRASSSVVNLFSISSFRPGLLG